MIKLNLAGNLRPKITSYKNSFPRFYHCSPQSTWSEILYKRSKWFFGLEMRRFHSWKMISCVEIQVDDFSKLVTTLQFNFDQHGNPFKPR